MDVRYERTGSEATGVGKYRLIAGLGRGGMASVHLAVMHGPGGFNKLVVLKQIHPEYAEDPEILGMFRDEAQLAARLSHPNVVQTNEVGQEGQHHFLAMEYLDGQPLNRINRRMERHGGLPLVLHLRVIADLLNGLHYAHELTDYNGAPLGVVHRDVTPQNIFVTYDGSVKIIDFGIAKAQTALMQTRVGIIKGKIAYMAPEQARGEPVDRRADIFAVGVMMWEAATGKRPWEGLPELTVINNLLHGDFPSPRSVRPDIAPALEAIIVKALAHDRRDRHATAADLQAEVEAFIATSGERLQQRELGRLVSHHFAGERAKLKLVIEEQLQVVSSAATALPIILDEGTMSTAEPLVDGSGEEQSQLDSSSIGANTLRTISTRRDAGGVEAREARGRSRRRALLRAGAVVIGAALIVASGLSLRWRSARVEAAGPTREAPPIAASVIALGAPASASAGPIASTVELRISASPPEARLFLDDVPLEGNPWKGDLPRASVARRIRIEAPGFVGQVEPVTLDGDRSFSIVLVPEALVIAPPAGHPGSPRARAKGTARSLDPNPYSP